jgi:hypothetical protein
MSDRDDHSDNGSDDQQPDDGVVSSEIPDEFRKLSMKLSSKKMMLSPVVLGQTALELRLKNASLLAL